jgi:hypothetical protein
MWKVRGHTYEGTGGVDSSQESIYHRRSTFTTGGVDSPLESIYHRRSRFTTEVNLPQEE